MKIPIIRKGEYDIWSMRMRQYICPTNHNLWDVIVNGDLEEELALTREIAAPLAPKTAKQLAAKRNQERVKSILLLSIPDEYLLKFHNVADAKSSWEAIQNHGSTKIDGNGLQVPLLLLRTWHFFPLRTLVVLMNVLFLCKQPNNCPNLKEDFSRFDEDDLEELDLRWQLAMLTVRKYLKEQTLCKLKVNIYSVKRSNKQYQSLCGNYE
ncbi:hypothetical protein Tco_1255400 [Tanacetum coccineum]